MTAASVEVTDLVPDTDGQFVVTTQQAAGGEGEIALDEDPRLVVPQ